MDMFIKIAWRYIFRNVRRTVITGIAIGVGLAGMIFTDAFMVGMKQNIIETVTDNFLGEAQIHAEGFTDNYDPEKVITGTETILRQLKNEPEVEHVSQRVMTNGLINSAVNSRHLMLCGIDPHTEKMVSEIDEKMATGTYLDNTQSILIGKPLAEELEVQMGDRIVVTVSMAESGELAQEMLRIGGIYHFEADEMDKQIAFVHIDKLRALLGLKPDESHEIVIHLTDAMIASNINYPLWAKYSKNGLKAEPWPQLVPELDMTLHLFNYAIILLSIVIFGVVVFGIVNTLFMSLYERFFEFGVLKAVGTRSFNIWKMIVYEACSLAVISILIGILLGFLVTIIFMKIGISFDGVDLGGVTVQRRLYPVIGLYQYIIYPIVVLLFTAGIGIYPATFAAKLKPAQAMRKSM
jgi:ABC-type lipoprotein release transport system permease subunit